MTSRRIKEIQDQTAYPESRSVMLALKQVWNECEQEQNKKLYSEEEVHIIIESYQNNVENNPIHITYEEWFEQFKKK